ncbi:MAG: addiction module toxin, HicA family [Candidatus Zambryskibacteria bacterium CG10_big_fil_rev_8_21_14_0_10_34_34]|uniref:Addiction module toxin, HicA family n=1 Tax=Candidatus Zambryskibacteria bacterium CG10_big_fil_rev_8_21_14_0_10_34_34 TaxID=1975114 RepID=A0A2H0R0Y2_9BACT|nr:MAG: addiction module toxin, HicA family [Candidatus Zambryskibacteria bacterium CG10_big_fil_rev_8_21_14_0_10_34_34]
MKRLKFISYLNSHNCILIREGNKHSIFYNIKNEKTSSVPRHSEINNFLARKICRDLGISIITIK